MSTPTREKLGILAYGIDTINEEDMPSWNQLPEGTRHSYMTTSAALYARGRADAEAEIAELKKDKERLDFMLGPESIARFDAALNEMASKTHRCRDNKDWLTFARKAIDLAKTKPRAADALKESP